MEKNSVFKKCPNCGFVWNKREDFLEDPEIRICGYQLNRSKLLSGLFLFHHGCLTTLAIEVEQFRDLYTGAVHQSLEKNPEHCPGYCDARDSLQKCTVLCEGVFAREILLMIKNWPNKCNSSDCHYQNESPVQIQL